jgi:hypothetical protein
MHNEDENTAPSPRPTFQTGEFGVLRGKILGVLSGAAGPRANGYGRIRLPVARAPAPVVQAPAPAAAAAPVPVHSGLHRTKSH